MAPSLGNGQTISPPKPAQGADDQGACFTDYSGSIVIDAGALCVGYLDKVRGVLKVTDVAPADDPAIVPGFPEGAYHICDYHGICRKM